MYYDCDLKLLLFTFLSLDLIMLYCVFDLWYDFEYLCGFHSCKLLRIVGCVVFNNQIMVYTINLIQKKY